MEKYLYILSNILFLVMCSYSMHKADSREALATNEVVPLVVENNSSSYGTDSVVLNSVNQNLSYNRLKESIKKREFIKAFCQLQKMTILRNMQDTHSISTVELQDCTRLIVDYLEHNGPIPSRLQQNLNIITNIVSVLALIGLMIGVNASVNIAVANNCQLDDPVLNKALVQLTIGKWLAGVGITLFFGIRAGEELLLHKKAALRNAALRCNSLLIKLLTCPENNRAF